MEKATLKVRQTGIITLKNTKLNKSVIEWKSSNMSVASVNASGKITALSTGECLIYTETGGIVNECKVIVR